MAPLLRTVSSVSGPVPGRFREETLVCQFTDMVNSGGYMWSGGSPFSYSLPIFLAQLAVIVTLSRTICLLLEPLKQSMLSAQLIAGILLGNSFMGRMGGFTQALFPPRGRITLETAAEFGLLFHLFTLGINVNPSINRNARKDAIAIGVAAFMLPFTIGIFASIVLPRLMDFDGQTQELILRVITLNSLTWFPVVTSVLSDLNILNSEIGRMATLACSVNEVCNYVLYALIIILSSVVRYKRWYAVWYLSGVICLIALYGYVARPWMLHLARTIPEGKPLKESQFLAILISALMCGFFTEFIGVPAGIGAFIFGMAIPDGPPVGSCLIQKVDTFCTRLLLPAKFAISGLSTDIFAINNSDTNFIIGLAILLSYMGKFTGVLLTAVYFKNPISDAVSLALIMCCKGTVEITIYILLKEDKMIDDETYALLLITMLIVTGIARPLVSFIYDPSKRFSSDMANSIIYSNPKSELRIMVCVHHADNVPAIINLLEASNPTLDSPICVFVLNLFELSGRAAAVLERNIYQGRLTSMRSRSEHIAKAFNYFWQKNPGITAMQHFTSISPYASMNVDICTVASDARANIMILPFHKMWEIDGTIGTNLPAIRTVNLNVIQKAPCSVGILVDRGHIASNLSILPGNTRLFITMLFIGGPDDREALAYASRMVGNPRINLTLVWLTLAEERSSMEDAMDDDIIAQFRANTIANERVFYKEEVAKDAVCTTRVLRSLEDGCDLCIVGRQHDPDSPLTQGLTEWSECLELGAVGDMLATTDFRFSLLVVQQLPPGPGFGGSSTLDTVPSSRHSRH